MLLQEEEEQAQRADLNIWILQTICVFSDSFIYTVDI